MFVVELAQLNIAIDNKYQYIEDMCKDYITDKAADFTVAVTDEEIKAEESVEGDYPAGYLESLAVYRKIADRIIDYDGFLMHGVILDVEDVGVAFCAKSGTGKTTHMLLWKQLLGGKCTIINGDKPLVRIIDGNVYAYGTPWAGKEGFNKNDKTKLKKLCFINRSEENEVIPCTGRDVLEQLMSQIFIPQNGIRLLKTLDLLDRLIKSTDIYSIKCNMDISAAETAYEGILK